MTNAWRAVGITYIQYSNIAARVLREALRTELRADAAKRNDSHVKFTPWANGKPAHLKE
ncbi:protein stunted isoform X2 [Scaptodrosophila lebanonensis]|uniref:Protein stunted isoform X2 n=1 Tax=Drosophila lebanonensis TaxID=7225 RepID=A0A6J2TZH2_DROLE|nr:protein stunted isoform X2 [Scaptodrosophila lebanonensis]